MIEGSNVSWAMWNDGLVAYLERLNTEAKKQVEATRGVGVESIV
jgi:hypothetical protein